jgi:hypothetical protein
MEHDLRRLRHARDRSRGKVSELVDVPRILIGLNEVSAVVSVLDLVEEELTVRFNRVDAC